MAKAEIDQIIRPYEFEDRGNLFMEEVAKIMDDFQDLLVEVENKTLRDLEANTWACKKSLEKKNPRLYAKAFERGEEKDYLSGSEVVISVSIHGLKRKRVEEFKRKVDKCAKAFYGKKVEEENESKPDAPEGEHRFFTYVDYCFRG